MRILEQVCLSYSAELSPVQDSIGSVGCGHGQNLSKVLLGTNIARGNVLQEDQCQSQCGVQ